MMRNSASVNSRRIALGVSALAMALASAPALAQTGAAADTSGVDEIVVTAQFREQSVQDTPLAITAISADMLESLCQTRISDITAQAPNVLLQLNPAGQGNSI